jgi:hypothetical protein
MTKALPTSTSVNEASPKQLNHQHTTPTTPVMLALNLDSELEGGSQWLT